MLKMTGVLTAGLLALMGTDVLALQVDVLTLRTNDIVFDGAHGKIYASVPSTAGVGLGNSITTINRSTLSIDRSVFIGSEPGKLALASDGSVLYAALDGAGAFRSYNASTFTAGTQVSLGTSPFTGQYFVEDIAVMPGSPGTVAISRRNQGFSPRHEGVVIYDGNVRRPVETQDPIGSNYIEFSDSGATLYGFNTETTNFGFNTMSVGSDGVQVTNSTSNLISGFGIDIAFTDGRIYATSGRVIDPVTRTLLGTFASSGLVAADADTRIVYFLEGVGSARLLKLFDMDTFVLRDTITINGVSGIASSLILLEDHHLAFRTSADQLFVVNTVPLPAAAWMLLGGLSLLGVRMRRASNAAARHF